MRRWLILACATATTVAAVMLAAASPAAPIVICPVAGAHAGAVPGGVVTCCGTPAAQAFRSDVMPAGYCCPGNALCARLLSISASPNPSTASQKVVISGSLGAASTPPGGSVTVWQRLPGQSQFQKLADTAPDSSGNYSLTQSPTTNRQWYATANGLRSITVQQQVQATLKLRASVGKRGTVVLNAVVFPAHAHQRLMLEARSSKGWSVLAHPRLDKRSRARMRLTFSLGGSVTFRVTLPGDSRNVQSSSAPTTVAQH